MDDITLPRTVHAAFLRSSHGRALIGRLGTRAAAALPGVLRVVTGQDLHPVCKGWRGNSKTFPGMNAPLQRALAIDEVFYQGEPVAIVLASSRAIAEDAVALVEVEWLERPSAASLTTASDAPSVHPELSSNVGWRTRFETPGFAEAFAEASLVVEDRITFGRHTGVTLEPRGLIAEYDSAEGILTLHHSHQVPNQIQQHFGDMLGIGEHRLRVVCPDVGGGFGIKLHLYSDELAIAAASLLVERPVKWIADRLESFSADIHAREHIVDARIAVSRTGDLVGFEVHDLCGMGVYSIYPRSSPIEAVGVISNVGAPYSFPHYRASAEAVFQNKAPTGMYRAVGFPISCTVTERLMDRAAVALGEDPLAFRRRCYMQPEQMPCLSPNGSRLFELSHEACTAKLASLMNYDTLKAERDSARQKGILCGIGFATFVEMTATGIEVYGSGEVPIIAMDSITLKVEPSGGVRCLASITEQGQGTTAGIQQIVSDALGVPLELVTVVTGDTAAVPAGGGAWASRGIPIGGEAAWEAGLKLKTQILTLAGRLLQSPAETLDLVGGDIVDAGGAPRMTLRELAGLAYLRTHQLPSDADLGMVVSHQHRRTEEAFIPTNGIQASYVEVDGETGLVRLLGHWCVEDCGRLINPLLVDEQLRGGIMQGIGAALYEHCRYDGDGQLLTASMVDYLVPMAGEMPDIVIGHVETPYSRSALGAKGAGEAGTCAGTAVILNAVNDALLPLGVTVSDLPMTPTVILRALGRVAA